MSLTLKFFTKPGPTLRLNSSGMMWMFTILQQMYFHSF